jgi:hypothetical protein
VNGAWRGGVALACLLGCGPAVAAGFNLVGGPSATASQHFTGAAFVSVFGQTAADGRFHVEPIATLGWVDARRTTRGDLDHEVFLAGGGLRLVTAGGHWFVSEQIAVTSGRTDALSSRFEFVTSGGWQHDRFVVMLRHISNAHVLGGGKNLGETMLLAGLRW